jgi:hypothetical protein
VYKFFFWIYLPHMSFWTWLIVLNMLICSSINLSTNDIISLLFMIE